MASPWCRPGRWGPEAGRERWGEVGEQNLAVLRKLGKLTDDEVVLLLARMQQGQQALPSGRWLWIGGTPVGHRQQQTSHRINGQKVAIKVRDTGRGWVDSYGCCWSYAQTSASKDRQAIPMKHSVWIAQQRGTTHVAHCVSN